MNVLVAQKNFTVGNLKGNADIIIDTVKRSAEDLIVFSELCVSGYPPLDLLDSEDFIQQQSAAVEYMLQETKYLDKYFVLGYLEKNEDKGKPLFNSLAVCYKGEIVFKYHKRLLPTYDIFDEDRYFEPGEGCPIFHCNGIRIGFAICEDLWMSNRYKKDPIEELCLYRPDVVVSLNASPSIIGKHEDRLKLIEKQAKNYGLDIIYANQVGGNDDIVFDGNSFYMSKTGLVSHHANSFQEEEMSFTLNTNYTGSGNEKIHANMYLNGHKDGFYDTEAEFFCGQAILGIRDYVNKNGFQKVVIGESGGIDSAVTTAIAAEALGPERVIAVTMPSKHSSAGSVDDSKELCDRLGVELLTIPIADQYETFMKVFNTEYGYKEIGVTEQNVQARIRGQILMAISNREHALVLSTGNKSELSVGYTTIYGDMVGGIDPIADCYKMEVYAMGRYLDVPKTILDKEPSAELAEGQKDTDSLPPYPALDTALKYFIEGEGSIETVRDALERYGWPVDRLYKMLRNVEYKRRQAAVGVKMHKKAFGFGRRYPIVNKFNLFGSFKNSTLDETS